MSAWRVARRLAGLILGAAVFFPVSCTSSLFVGTHVIAKLNSRDMSRGDVPYPGQYFSLLAQSPGQIIVPTILDESTTFHQKHPDLSFRLSQQQGATVSDQASYTWQVLESRADRQVVEVTCVTDDWRSRSTYSVIADSVTPLRSYLFHHGHMFGAFPYAFFFAFVVLCFGRCLRTS